jgi:hypothetical protein
MSIHTVEPYKREDGKLAWRVKVGDDVIATDGSQGYENKKDMLDAFFGMFFGTFDESFLELYSEWNPPVTEQDRADDVALNAISGVTNSDDVTRGGMPGGEVRKES